MALAHKFMADAMTKFIGPIESFIQTCQKEMTPKAETLVYGWKQYQKLVQDTLALEAKAILLWDAISGAPASSLEDEVDELLYTVNMLKIGSRKVPADDFNRLIAKLQNKIPSEDIWRLLGTYKDCYNGELMLNYLKQSMMEQDAREFLTYLCQHNYIKSIEYTGTVNSFTTTITP